jgi:hypothetical protein
MHTHYSVQLYKIHVPLGGFNRGLGEGGGD